MQSETKLTKYRELRNFVCSQIAKAENNYTNAVPAEKYTIFRKHSLDTIAFYKDVLAILTKYKELLCNE